MSEYSFIIDNMKWSYSRLSSFEQCKFAWRTQYIECIKGEQNAMSQYGSFCHKILEMYASGELMIFQLADYYTEHFCENVTFPFPNNKYVDIRESYYMAGLKFFAEIDLVLDKYEILGIEKEIIFQIDGKEFIGYIDLLLRDKDTKEIIIVDHKSAELKFKKNGELSKTSFNIAEGFKHQLYLYSKAVYEIYGAYPKWLVWNLFRQQKYYHVPFVMEEYNASIDWATDTLHKIDEEELWAPNPDYFFCYNICNYRNKACPYKPNGYAKKDGERNAD